MRVSCQSTKEQVQRVMLQNEFKMRVHKMKQQDVFELQRPGMSISGIDVTWLQFQSDEFQQLLTKMGNWLDCATVFPWVTDFKFNQLYGISREERECWIKTGVGAVTKWMRWSAMNCDYVEKSLLTFSYSTRIVAPLDTKKTYFWGVRAKGAVGFDMVPVLLDPLERLVGGKNFFDVRLEDRWANVRMGLELWMTRVHGYASWATRLERFKISRLRNGIGVDGVIMNEKYEHLLRPSNPDFVKYLAQFGYVYPEVEIKRLWQYYFRSLPYDNFLQYVFVSTIHVRSPFKLVEEISNVVGNMVIASIGTRIVEEVDDEGYFTEISRAAEGRWPMKDGISQLQLKSAQLSDFSVMQSANIDLMCCLDRKIGIMDIEGEVLKYVKEVQMKMQLCSSDGVLITYDCIRSHKEWYSGRDRLGKGCFGVPIEVSSKSREYEATREIVPLIIYTIVAQKPIHRVSLSVGGPTWKTPLSNQPGIQLYQDPKNLCAVKFSVDEVLGNVWIVLRTDDGMGIRRIGHFPEISLPITDVCAMKDQCETGAYVCYFKDPETDCNLALYRAQNDHIGLWIVSYKQAVRGKEVLSVHPARWTLIEDESGCTNLPMTWMGSVSMKASVQAIATKQYFSDLPDRRMLRYEHGERRKF